MSDSPVMKRGHPFWYAFTYKMQQLDPESGCQGNFDHAIEILNTYPGVDIQESLNFYRHNGAFCDCEIIINYILAEEAYG